MEANNLTAVVEYQQLVEDVQFEDFEASGSGKDIVAQKKSIHVGRVKEMPVVGDTALMVMGAVSTAALVGGWLLRNSNHLPSLRIR